jgi:hypothetical protein
MISGSHQVSGSGRAEPARTAPVKNVEPESSGATDTKTQQRSGEKNAAQGPRFFCLEKNRDQNRINLLIQVFSGLYSLFLTISPLIFP